MMKIKAPLILSLLLILSSLQAQYISQVLEYTPAPGQFINTAPWGLPDSTNESVSIVGKISGAMTLGAYGGYVIFGFDAPVENHPDNPFGVDFTIFGNPLTDWSEPGVAWVMKDANNNGLPDDIWYELAGSDNFFSSTIKNYEVRYSNPQQAVASDIPWTDNHENNGAILANGFHRQSYYPSFLNYPDIDSISYTLTGTMLKSTVDRSMPANIKSYRRAFGYADNQLRGKAPYTIPDNPYTDEVENSGGDAFDISWAIDENGQYVTLDEIHFVKVQNGVLADAGWLGEVSTEITGAIDIAPDTNITGELDMIIIKPLPDTIVGNSFPIETFVYHQGRLEKDRAIQWSSNINLATVTGDSVLRFTESGLLTLTATIADRPEIEKSISAELLYTAPLNLQTSTQNRIKLFPNPSSDFIHISGVEKAIVTIYDSAGNTVHQALSYHSNEIISIRHLQAGNYIVSIHDDDQNSVIRLIKK